MCPTTVCYVMLFFVAVTRGQQDELHYRTDIELNVDELGVTEEVIPVIQVGEVTEDRIELHVYNKKYDPNTQLLITYENLSDGKSGKVSDTLLLGGGNHTHTIADLLVDQEYRVCGEVIYQGQTLERRCYNQKTYQPYDPTTAGVIVGVCVAALLVVLVILTLVYKMYLRTKIKSWTLPKHLPRDRPERGHVNHKSTQALVV